jgi:hypothetical protein
MIETNKPHAKDDIIRINVSLNIPRYVNIHFEK